MIARRMKRNRVNLQRAKVKKTKVKVRVRDRARVQRVQRVQLQFYAVIHSKDKSHREKETKRIRLNKLEMVKN